MGRPAGIFMEILKVSRTSQIFRFPKISNAPGRGFHVVTPVEFAQVRGDIESRIGGKARPLIRSQAGIHAFAHDEASVCLAGLSARKRSPSHRAPSMS